MISFTYTRQQRIRKHKDFLLCYKQGKKFHSQNFFLYAFNSPGEMQRTGMAVSRKVGNAVKRNRVKRLLREFFRLRTFVLPNMQLVVVAKNTAASLNFSQVESELLPIIRCLQKELDDPLI